MWALELRDVRKRFGKTEVIRGASLHMHVGECCAVIGPNGAGKSTLFNLISGRLSPSSGQIFLNGRSIAGLRPYQIHRLGLARSFQISSIFPRLNVFENLRCAALWSLGYRYSFWRRLNGLQDVREHAEQILEQIGMASRRNIEAGLLTYAEQRALEIGITIAGGADVILLDEPTAGMSRSEAAAAVEMIRRTTAGKTLLIVEHDMNVVFKLADRVAVLVNGEIIACDTPAAIKSNPRVQEAYLGMDLQEAGRA